MLDVHKKQTIIDNCFKYVNILVLSCPHVVAQNNFFLSDIYEEVSVVLTLLCSPEAMHKLSGSPLHLSICRVGHGGYPLKDTIGNVPTNLRIKLLCSNWVTWNVINDSSFCHLLQ